MLAKSKQLRLLAFATSLLLALLAGEVLSRILLPPDFGQPRKSDERNMVYTHDSELGWYAVPNATYTFERSRPITIRYNSLGLQDIEFDPNDERKRLLFLGDSYVWGFDVKVSERFTDILRSSLQSWQIVNAGISGYGTDQELLLLRGLAPILKPDHVFVMFCKNDRDDNTHNVRRRGYYKPYFVLENGRLVKKGTPVPLSVNQSSHLGMLAHSKLYLFLSFFG